MHERKCRNTNPGTDEDLYVTRCHIHVVGEKTGYSVSGLKIPGWLFGEKKKNKATFSKLHVSLFTCYVLPHSVSIA